MDVGTRKFSVGQVNVVAEIDRGHSVEFWADTATDKICGISKDAAPHVRQQAEAFREEVRDQILWALRGAIRSDRQTVAGALRKDGYGIMAGQLLAYGHRSI